MSDEINKKIHAARNLCWHVPNHHPSILKEACIHCGKKLNGWGSSDFNPDYTSSLEAAFELVEFMKGDGYGFTIGSGPEWCVVIDHGLDRDIEVVNESLPRAIATACARALNLED